jgi:hypothetical protein
MLTLVHVDGWVIASPTKAAGHTNKHMVNPERNFSTSPARVIFVAFVAPYAE